MSTLRYVGQRAMLSAMALLMQASCSSAPVEEPMNAAPDLLAARLVEGRYENPPGSPTVQNTWQDGLSFWWTMTTASGEAVSPPLPPDHAIAQTKVIPALETLQAIDTLTWLGHASFLIRIDGKVVLTDPFLTKYASPVTLGPKRYVEPGIGPEQLPPIDLLLISHNHYDHMDRRTLARLPHPERITVVVPVGLADSLREYGFKEIRELTWGEATRLDALGVTAVPAIHFSGRGLFDKNKTLWAGFILSGRTGNIYFAGDTGYHDQVFKQIREAFGPVDVALVPIGAYEPANLMRDIHVNPEEAVAIGRDLGATTLVAMHWGTIVLATEPPFEAPTRFRAAGKTAGYADDALWAMQIGQTRAVSLVRSEHMRRTAAGSHLLR
jgi:N-acyl-phosphatidylethanolamine-hydrolysing phospholipase D